jgi:hypothetical protein
MHQAAVKGDISLGVAVFDPQQPLALDQLLERAAKDLEPTAASS